MFIKRLLVLLLAAAWLGVAAPASAQGPVKLCYPTTTDPSSCITVNSANPLPITGSFSATITFPTIGAAVPLTGIYSGLNVAGVLRGTTGLALGSTFSPTVAIVDAGGNQITAFGATGTTSNASSAVATSSTNVPTVAYNYGFNGATWDQLQVDASKNLKTGVTAWAGSALGAMANYGTSPGAVLVPGANVFVTNTNSNGRATPANSSPVVLPANKYIAVAASQTATALVGAGSGAAGDYLSHCVIFPTSTSPGVVTVFDSTNTAANSAILFAGGSTSTSNLTPISVPVGAVSVNGAWKVTTGTAVSVVCYGNFT